MSKYINKNKDQQAKKKAPSKGGRQKIPTEGDCFKIINIDAFKTDSSIIRLAFMKSSSGNHKIALLDSNSDTILVSGWSSGVREAFSNRAW